MEKYEIKATNIFYVSNFNVIGGVETFIYELTRKYKEYDIAVVYKTGHMNQIERIMKNARIHKYKGGKIKCERFFCNYETDIIDQVDAEEYTQIIHAMFKTNRITPRLNPKVTKYLAVSKTAAEEFHELTGKEITVCRNPLQVTEEEKKPILTLISATRLTPEKGKWRMEKLAQALDRAGIDYIWYIYTNDKEKINSKNIAYIEPRLNIRPLIANIKGHGYGVQLSDCEGDCYFTRECEALGVPLIVTPVQSFKEQGLTEGENCYYMPFDMKELNIERLKTIPEYEGYIGQDRWLDQIKKNKSTYEEVNMKVKLRCIRGFFDVERNQDVTLGDEWTVTKERAEQLEKNPNHLVEVVEYIEEPKIEKAVKPKRKVTKR